MEMKNDEIRISTDAMIALVVTEAEERELAKMPSLQEMNEAFHPSDQFLKKMDKLLRTAKNKQRMRQWQRVAKRTAVCFTVLVTLFTCMMMPAKAVQKAVATTLIEWQDKFMRVIFSSDATKEQKLPETIELSYIPDGFSQRDAIIHDEYSFLAVYANEHDSFRVYIITMEDQAQISVDNENTTFYTLCFSDCEALLGMSEKGINTLVWNKNNFIYRVSGTLDLKEMIQIAENIKM